MLPHGLNIINMTMSYKKITTLFVGFTACFALAFVVPVQAQTTDGTATDEEIEALQEQINQLRELLETLKADIESGETDKSEIKEGIKEARDFTFDLYA